MSNSIPQNGHRVSTGARNGASHRSNAPNGQQLGDRGTPYKTGAVWDFLAATRDIHAFRLVRDRFPDFDLEVAPSDDDNTSALMLWRLRCDHDHSSTQSGEVLDEAVARTLLSLCDSSDEARDALAWLRDGRADFYSPIEAKRRACTLAKEWSKAAEKLQPRFNFKTLSQLELEPDPDWLIYGFLTEGGTSLLTAKHGSYKSFFALEMALCVACDFPFHGHEVKAGCVVYVAAEGASGIKKRAKAWRTHHDQEVAENFVVLDVPLQVHDDATRAAFIEEVAALQPVLIIFDTLARCAVGLDENNAGDMGRFADALSALARATGAHVLTVHHNAKGGEYRGSTAIPAAVDTHITLSKGEGKKASVTLEMPKQKDFEALYPITFEPVEVAFKHMGKDAASLIFKKGENATGSGDGPSSIERKVLEALKAIATEAGVSSTQWKAATEGDNISNGAFYKAQKRLVTPACEDGLGLVVIISGEHNGRGAKCARYGIELHNSKVTPNGDAELPDSPHNSTTPQLHSPLGSGVVMELGVSEEVAADTNHSAQPVKEKKVRKPRKATNTADSEPYNAAG